MIFRLLWYLGLIPGHLGDVVKKFYYFVFVLFFGACSVTTEESSSEYGSSDGTAATPVVLTVGTAKAGSVAKYGYSYYKFTTSSTGAGSYKLAIASLSITDSYSSSSSVRAYLYSGSGYNISTQLDSESCVTSCTLYFDYENRDASTTYYLEMYGYGKVTYSLTMSQGGSEGSKNNPVVLTLGQAHTGGKVEGYFYNWGHRGNSYYKFTTTSADNYTLSMNNSDDLDCFLFTNSLFSSSYVSDTHNGCTVGDNLSTTFKGSKGTALSASTTYYLEIEQQASTGTTTTYDNMTVAAEG